MINTEQKRTFGNYALALVLCVVAVVAANWLFPTADPVQQATEERLGEDDVLALFQTKAQLATTEVSLRRMGIYDSETRLATINPANWKIGRRACIVPVDITIKYGIDMRKLTASDVTIDSTKAVKIRLPKPEVIDYNVVMATNRSELVTMSGWLRDEVGEQTIQTVKNKVVKEVLADETLFNALRDEIQGNTRSIFTSMLQQMGLKPVFLN
ncbi:MAG: DUF4230 domain-containing protein [Prevotella sp.]|nr:DUF4230 domain-containing protein [Prevotella sp.]